MEEVQKELAPEHVLYRAKWIFLSLGGLIVCLYLGWVYQTSWYWYYGMDAMQANLPLSTILQQGAALSLLILGLILIIFGLIFLLRLVVLSLRNYLFRERQSEVASLFSLSDFFARNFHFVVLVYVALIYIFLKEVEIHNSNYPSLEIPANIAMLEGFIVPTAALLFIRLLGDFLYALPEALKHRLRLTTETRVNDGAYRVILGLLVVLAVTAKFTGMMAIGDASVGFRQNSSYQAVRRVYLKSYSPIAGLEPYRQDCDCSPFVYGPLGYLEQNEEYLFLIPWKADGEEYFPQFPALYQIERSAANPINIVPDTVVPHKEDPAPMGHMYAPQRRSVSARVSGTQ